MDDGGLALSLRGPNENLPTASISFDTNDKQLEVGDTWEPLIQVLPADATITEPHWRNSNPDVVRLVMNHENGQMSVLALAEGTATIGVTAYLTDADGTFCGYVKTYCNITVSKQEIPEIPDLDPEPPTPPSSGGSSGSSGRPSDIKTETSKNPDGSTTTTVTDKKTQRKLHYIQYCNQPYATPNFHRHQEHRHLVHIPHSWAGIFLSFP